MVSGPVAHVLVIRWPVDRGLWFFVPLFVVRDLVASCPWSVIRGLEALWPVVRGSVALFIGMWFVIRWHVLA